MKMFGDIPILAPEFIIYVILFVFAFFFVRFLAKNKPTRKTLKSLWKYCADINWVVEMFPKMVMRKDFDKDKDYKKWAGKNSPKCPICKTAYLLCRCF